MFCWVIVRPWTGNQVPEISWDHNQGDPCLLQNFKDRKPSFIWTMWLFLGNGLGITVGIPLPRFFVFFADKS